MDNFSAQTDQQDSQSTVPPQDQQLPTNPATTTLVDQTQNMPIDPMDTLSPQAEPKSQQQAPVSNPMTPNVPPVDPLAAYKEEPKKKKKFPFLILLIIFFVLFAMIGSMFVVGVMAAYDNVKLPESMQKVDDVFTGMVMKVPLFPKTPKMVLMGSVLAHEDVSTAYTEISMAIDMPDLNQLFLNQVPEFLIKGPIDFTNPEKPNADLTVNLSNQFGANVIVNADKWYFKLTQLPAFAWTYLGEAGITNTQDNPIMNKWVEVPFSDLQTDAAKALKEDADSESVQMSNATEKAIEKYLNESILPMIQMVEEKSDSGEAVYKMTLDLTGTQVDEFMRVMAEDEYGGTNDLYAGDYVKVESVKVNLFFGKTDYLMRKGTMVMTLKSKLPSASQVLGRNTSIMNEVSDSEGETAKISMGISFSRYGEQFVIKAPEGAVDVEDYSLSIGNYMRQKQQEMYMQDYFYNDTNVQNDFGGFSDDSSGFDGQKSTFDPVARVASARNMQRKGDVTDLASAISVYLATTGKLPGNIPADGSSYQIGTCSAGGNVSCPTAKTNCVNLSELISGSYLKDVPLDPLMNDPKFSGYMLSGTNTSVTVTACMAENNERISQTY